MIRSSPCDFYLKYLCSHPDGYSDEQIRNLVKLQQLDFLGMRHLQEVRSQCVVPVPFYPEDLTHHASQRFLRKERIYSLHHMDDDVVTAVKLLDHPRGKELAEALLISEAAPTWVSSALMKLDFDATPRSIELYKHYYFNTDLLSKTELRAVIGMRASKESFLAEDPDEKLYRLSYHSAHRQDACKLSAEMSMAPMAQAMNLMRMGYMPSSVEISRIVSMGRTAAAIRSADCSLAGKAKGALDFGMTAKILSEMMESVGDSGDDLQAALMKMTLKTESSTVPLLEELSGGDHTMDLIAAEGESVEVE